MKIFLDSNYIIYLLYARNTELQQFVLESFKELLFFAKENLISLIANVTVFNEILWILHKKYSISYIEIENYLEKIISYIEIAELSADDYQNMLRFLKKYTIQPSDALHLSTIFRMNIDCVFTEDSHFKNKSFCQVIWIENWNDFHQNNLVPLKNNSG